jgi:hypothetical protein
MLGVGCLPHQPSHAFDDMSTPEFDRVSVVVISSDILRSVLFALRESLIIWHASQEHLDAIHIFELWKMQSAVFFVQHVVLVLLHSDLLDPELDICVLFAVSQTDSWDCL